jgi:phytoene/squalene synthetase
MQYHIFKEKGLQIGSEAIESAHKDVLQKRPKLSGKRWTKLGLQLMT